MDLDALKSMVLESYIYKIVNLAKSSFGPACRQPTYGGRTSIQAIFYEFFDHGAEVNNDLARLNLMHLQIILAKHQHRGTH